MKRQLSNVLIVLGLVAGAVLIAITMGLFPAREPAPIEAVPLALPKLLPAKPKTVEKTGAVAVHANALSLCAAPLEAPRIYAVAGAGHAQSFFVWCRGGYSLFDLDVTGAAPSLSKVAHLPTDMVRPGGAALVDVTADGVRDLVVGVAPKEGAVHAPGSGVFLLRGRAQGGFEAALPLVEIPIVALATVQLRALPAAPDLFALTRGDAAAQRVGQLVWFEAGPTPLKKGTFNAGLLPRDLRAAELADAGAFEMLVLASEPGRVTGIRPLDTASPTREVALPDGAQLCASQDPRFLLARTTHDLFRVTGGGSLALTPWFQKANVGSCATGDLDRDGTPDALAVTDAGVIWLRDAGEDGSHELTLPAGYRALDVAYLSGEVSRVLLLVHDLQREQLLLLVWPGVPWTRAGTLSFALEPEREPSSVAEIPLE